MVEAVGAQLMEFGSSPVWEQYLKEWRGRRLGRGLEQLLLFIIHFFPNIHQHGHTKIVFFCILHCLLGMCLVPSIFVKTLEHNFCENQFPIQQLFMFPFVPLCLA